MKKILALFVALSCAGIFSSCKKENEVKPQSDKIQINVVGDKSVLGTAD